MHVKFEFVNKNKHTKYVASARLHFPWEKGRGWITANDFQILVCTLNTKAV